MVFSRGYTADLIGVYDESKDLSPEPGMNPTEVEEYDFEEDPIEEH